MTALRRCALPVLCVLFFLCFALSLSAAGSLEGVQDLYTLALDGASVSGKAAAGMQEREEKEKRPVSFAVWGQSRGQSVENRDLGRFASLTVIDLCGNSGLLFSSGTPLLREDTDGCLLDPATAQNLFGSSAPIGSKLQYGGRELTVRGILDVDRPLLLAQALPEGAALDHVTLQIPEGGSPQKLLGEFERRHALSGNWNAAEAWGALSRFFALLPPFVLLLSVVVSLLKTAFSGTEFPFLFFACLLAAGAVWFLTLRLTEFSFQVPEEFLPNKWSDFDFWGQLFAQKKEEFLLLLASEKTEFELAFLLPGLQAGGAALAAVLLFPLSLGRVKPKTGGKLWIWCSASFFLSFLFSLALGGGFAGDRLLWLCLPVYFAASFLARRLSQWAAGITEGSRDLPAFRRKYRTKGRGFIQK